MHSHGIERADPGKSSLGFLSELAVSSAHGGGISVLRVVDRDLAGFDLFLHLGGFGDPADRPPELPYQERTIYRKRMSNRPWFQALLGNDRTCRTQRSERLIRRHSIAMVHRAARRFPLEGSKWLVCPQGTGSLYGSLYLKERYGARYISWVMDDHQTALRDGEWCYPYGTEDLMGAHLRNASHVFVGSRVMGQFYEDMFGVRCKVLLSPCSRPAEEPVDWKAGWSDGPLPVAYFGVVGPWQLDALELLCPLAAEGLLSLDIYSAQPLPDRMKSPGVRFRGCIPPEQVVGQMREYAAVVLPVGFGQGRAYMSRFNVATKVSECLASGTMTLVLAPPYAATVDLLGPEDVAVLVTSRDPASVRHGVSSLSDRALRGRQLENARAFVRKELSPGKWQGVWDAGWSTFVSSP